MADTIDTIPARITAVDTSVHEYVINANLLNGVSPLQLIIEVTTGTYTFSVGKTITGQSGSYAASSNKIAIITLFPGSKSIFVQATTIGDSFVISV